MCCHENCTNNCRIPIDTPAVIPATSLPALAQSLQQGPLQLNSEILSSLMGVDAAKLLGSVAVTSSQSTATSTSATPQSQGQQQSLFPCVVCYPGSSNVSLVWLPIDQRCCRCCPRSSWISSRHNQPKTTSIHYYSIVSSSCCSGTVYT